MKHLIIIDMQNDFIDGALSNDMAKAIVPEMADYIRNAVSLGENIIFTRDTHYPNLYTKSKEGKCLPEHCLIHTHGWDINKDLLDAAQDDNPNHVTFIDKKTFGYTDWKKYISHEDSVTLIGTCTEICVDANASILAALFPNMDIRVMSNLCAGLTKEGHKAALQTMRAKLIQVI